VNSPLRFAVLHHTGWVGRSDHFDLLLQLRDATDHEARVLKAFATVADTFPESGLALQPLEDHRKLYLNFEGPLSMGRGSVIRVDSGSLEWVQPWTATSTELHVIVSGTRFCGRFCIRSAQPTGFSLEKIADL
jgi:hypothetical protein